jgi:hypothetical protein
MRVVVLLLLVLLPVSIFAQEGYEHFSPVAHGAGKTYVTTSHGLSAIGLNPSLITPADNATLVINVFSGLGLDKGPSWSGDSLASVFNLNGGNISNSDRKRISNLLLNEKMSGRIDGEILAIDYVVPQLGTLAFSWTTHAALRTDIPDAFLTFFINAESQLLQFTNSYSGFDFSGMWYSEYSLTYAREIFQSKDFLSSLKIGGAIKYVSGTGYIGLDKNNKFAYEPLRTGGGTSIDVNYKVQSAYTSDFDPKNIPTSFSFKFITNNQAGSGLGMDLGASADFFTNKDGIPGLSIGTSICDIGSITWSSNATERVANNLHRDIKASGTISELNDSLKALSGILTHLNSFTTSLPTMFRIGAMLNMDQAGMSLPFFTTKAAVEYDAGLADVVGSLSHPRLGFGISGEHYNSVASLRAEIGYYIQHGQSDLTIGVGTTLFNHISVDVATAHLGDLFATEARTDLALAVRAQF